MEDGPMYTVHRVRALVLGKSGNILASEGMRVNIYQGLGLDSVAVPGRGWLIHSPLMATVSVILTIVKPKTHFLLTKPSSKLSVPSAAMTKSKTISVTR